MPSKALIAIACLLVILIFYFWRAAHSRTMLSGASIRLNSPVDSVACNGVGECLVIDSSGGAFFVDGRQGLIAAPIARPPLGSKYSRVSMGTGGDSVIDDTEGRLYHYSPDNRKLQTIKTPALGGEIVGLAFDEKTEVVWCAINRFAASDPTLKVISVAVSSGRVLASAAFGVRASNTITEVDSQTGCVLVCPVAPPDKPGPVYLLNGRSLRPSPRKLPGDRNIAEAKFERGKLLLGLDSGELECIDEENLESEWILTGSEEILVKGEKAPGGGTFHVASGVGSHDINGMKDHHAS